MMDSYAISAVEDFVHAGYPVDAAAILLCELDGTVEEVEDQIERVEELFRSQGATGTWIAKDSETRAPILVRA